MFQQGNGFHFSGVFLGFMNQFFQFFRVSSPIFQRVSLGSRFFSFYRVPGPGFFVFLGSRKSPTRVPGPSFPVSLGSCQCPTRVSGPGFLVFLGSHQGPGFSVFLESHQGPTRVPGPCFLDFLGSRQNKKNSLDKRKLRGAQCLFLTLTQVSIIVRT